MRLYKIKEINAVLKKMEIKELYPWQEEVLQAIYAGKNLFIIAATSKGKSLVYQLPAILDTGHALTLVISPLRALQVDQVKQLTEIGVKAAALNSDLSKKKRKSILTGLSEICMLYLAPEQLSKQDFREALKDCDVERVVIDEAHVLAQDALSFRTAYGDIGQFIKESLKNPQIIACTATATKKEQKTIIKSLEMENPEIYVYPIRRENLHLSVKKITAPPRCKNKKAEVEKQMFYAVEESLRKWNGKGSVIIYSTTVHRAKVLKKWLKGRDWEVAIYTGKMSQNKRLKAQKDFLDGSKKIIVATNAFGLGINKPDVRLLIHAGLPLTLSGYTQEIGRAGRDGKKSKCILFYSPSEFQRNERILKYSQKEEAVQQGLEGLDAMKKLLKSSKCLWSQIEKYYGQKSGEACGHCSHCKMKKLKK